MGALVDDPIGRAGLALHGDRAAALLVEIEARLDASALDGADIEALNAALITCKDALWSIRKDRIDLAAAVEDLLDGTPSGPAALEAFHAVQITLSAIDRLEVRGRDSAGLHLIVTGHGLDLDDPTDRATRRRAQPRPVVHRRFGAHPRGSPRVRLQDRGRDRRARRQHRAVAPRRSATTSCCTSRCAPRPRRRRCSRTRAGRASASSPRRTRTRSIKRSSTATAASTDRARTRSPRSTATSTTTPTSRRSTVCTSRPRSRPTPR